MEAKETSNFSYFHEESYLIGKREGRREVVEWLKVQSCYEGMFREILFEWLDQLKKWGV